MIDLSAMPVTVPVKLINQQCDEYRDAIEPWRDIDMLCRGGRELRKQAQRFLQKRPKEIPDVYNARIQRFTYQNIIGTALGWFQSATFKDEPEINFRRDGKVLGGDGAAANGDEFYAKFFANCDRSGVSLADFWRDRVYADLLKFGSAFVLTDLPAMNPDLFGSLAEQRSSGALDPYLVSYSPLQVINWETDIYGNLAWVVICSTNEIREFAKAPSVVDRWYYFDTVNYAVYEATRKEAKSVAETATLISAGPHSLADKKRVPVRRIRLPEDMNLGDRVYLHVLSHLNMQNAFYWGLTMGCLPTLYIKGEYQDAPTVSETAYIGLDENGDIGYVEPSGASFKIASDEIAAVREEIYRQLYLIQQGRDSKATPAAQSGISKEADMAPSRDVLNGFGKILRAGIIAVGQDIADARGDDVTVEVIGFDFEDDDTDGDIATAQLATDLDIPSDTLDKELKKGVARKILKGRRPEIVQAVEREIDAAPTKSELSAQQEQQQRDRFRQALATSLDKQANREALTEA